MKFRLGEKVKYMALGALVALISFIFGCINGAKDGQSIAGTVDELTVKTLIVRDKIVVTDGGPVYDVVITKGEYGGVVAVSDKKAQGRAAMMVGMNGGEMHVFPKEGNGKAVIKTADGSGTLCSAYAYLGHNFAKLR